MRFITADSIFNGEVFLKGHPALVMDGDKIVDILPVSEISPHALEKFDGILTPGFVNAHCHLELSHLKGLVPRHTGISGFAKELMKVRQVFPSEAIQTAIQNANQYMIDHGIVVCGDISNGTDSFETKINSPLYYHTFIELIGLHPAAASNVFKRGVDLLKGLKKMGLKGSLAPHAPYTVSRELFTEIAAYNLKNKTLLSVHNQESPEETDFFRGPGKDIRSIYETIGIDISWFEPSFANSFSYYFDTVKAGRSLLVHNTFTGEAEIHAARRSDVWWCFCPRANRYIENTLPDLNRFNKNSDRLCLGTDSLASNDDLNVLNEANVLLNHFKDLKIDSVLRMLTSNGAEALGLGKQFGQLHAGRSPGINLIVEQNRNLTFVKKVI